ncbi:hypothetical protein DRO64_03670 [Candidatus Bathyarchaeota archaeon]|nr:MAG: hypothetical protein DRO64_03670 [Candidatus Bathyarchaeota archaeon]
MPRKIWILVVIAGLIITCFGLALTQVVTTLHEEKKVMIKDVILTMPGNATLFVPLGHVYAGDRVEVRFTSTPDVTLTTVQTETGRPIEGMMETKMGTSYTGSFVKLAPITYDITEPMNLTVIVSIPSTAEYNNATISYLSVYVHPPTIYLYATQGIGLAVAGIIVTIVGIILRIFFRKT